ncbi:MAG: hypothetical protein EAZ42_11655 [Verrucomicrobia bacterium]|nr:MAG: hypothetical protein EAZ42_11655 [Verrucomicrobiota bacterium]
MPRLPIFLKALTLLAFVWLVVWGVRSVAANQKITAEKVSEVIAEASFADWSEQSGSAAEAKARQQQMKEIADMVNRLDFQEREKNRGNRDGETFFRKLSREEKSQFVEMTVAESMKNFMIALDAMSPTERKKFVEQGLNEIKAGRTEDDMARAMEMDSELLDKIAAEGMQAYFEKSSADTKLDLAPLMEAMNETMQGLRGNEFGIK